jgi:hypothetical protein
LWLKRTENTLSILNRYIDESEIHCDKNCEISIQDIYKQACEVAVMFFLPSKIRKDDGAYAVSDKYGEKVLFIFEDEDDASRYAMMLEEMKIMIRNGCYRS